MVKFGLVLAAAVTLAACGDQQSPFSGPVATSGNARACVVMGYRVGTTQHAYCVDVMSRRVSEDEYN